MRAITSSVLLGALAVASTTYANPAGDEAKQTDKQAKPTDKQAKPTDKQTKAVEPESIEALRKMSTFLTEQKSFSVHTESETDYVMENGQKVRLSSHGDVRVQRPSHLRAHVISDRKDREFFFDGKNFTVNSPKVGYYAVVPAPATIGELADELQAKYGLELPLVDLFRWSGKHANFADIESGTHIGTSEIDGVKTEHYAFRQKGVDWQIWIQAGDKPLPRKLVVTTTDDATRPEHSISMKWNLDEKYTDSLFTFTPPKDGMQIALAELGTPKADTSRRARRSPRR